MYEEVKGHSPPYFEMEKALSRKCYREDDRRENDAYNLIIGGCLQIAASRLIGQSTQESAGYSQMHQGLLLREDRRRA